MADILVLVSEAIPIAGTSLHVQYRVLTTDGDDGNSTVVLSTLGGVDPEAINGAILADARTFATNEWGTSAGADFLFGGQAPLLGTGTPADVTGSVGSAGGGLKSSKDSHRHKLGIVNTKGDLLGYSTQPVRIPVGSDGTTPVADSAEAVGWKWAAPSGDLYLALFSKAASNVVGTTTEGAGVTATNIGTSFKYIGLYGAVALDDYTTIRLVWDAQNGAGQSGLVSIEIWDVTSGVSRVTGTFTSDVRAQGDVSAAIAQTGVHTLAARIKGATSTDDPIFHSIGCLLER
jgi:hypothetical protein